ncbi:MAG TPA: glycosyltransferase family 2 protein [Terriglobales bacterium]|nr:glycosyltransferase family 2 protein [Terriglobales bacterium]
MAWYLVFWAGLLLVVYVYAGYPLLVWLAARLRGRPIAVAEVTPPVTLVIPAYNQERCIARKIENALQLDYPSQCLQILVVSDGSDDATASVARKYQCQSVEVLAFAQHRGKEELLNRALPLARGEMVAVSDAGALLSRDALRHLLRPFADAQVGGVTGARYCLPQAGSVASRGEGIYWRYESWIKGAESRLHSCLGGHGQLYAIRKSLFPRLGNSGDDFFVPMKVIADSGRRIVYAPAAQARIPAAASLRGELERKVRAHVALLRNIPLLWRLMVPGRSPVWWQYLSHHVLRMLVPPALLIMLLSAVALALQDPGYVNLLLAQLVFYSLAGLGAVLAGRGKTSPALYPLFYFTFAQLALLLAWIRWPTRRYRHGWQPTERSVV